MNKLPAGGRYTEISLWCYLDVLLFQNNTHYIAIPQNVSTAGPFFKTCMNLTHVVKEEICPVDIYIWCLVGRTSMQILEKHFTNCTTSK
jgi:hypothetical protein